MDNCECGSINIDFSSNIGGFHANAENVGVVNMDWDGGYWYSINVAIGRVSSMDHIYVAIRRKGIKDASIHYCQIIEVAKNGWRIGDHMCNGLLSNMSNAKPLPYDRYEILYEMTRGEFDSKIIYEAQGWTTGWQDE